MLTKPTTAKGTVVIRGSSAFLRTESGGEVALDACPRNVFDLASAKPAASPAPAHTGMLARKDLIGLYQAIEAALPDMESRVVQFASCHKGEGATTVGAELCAMASASFSHRTLLIDVYAGASPTATIRGNMASLADVASGRALTAHAVASSPSGALPYDYAYLTANRADKDILAHTDQLRQILATLRSQYRLIVFHASDVLADPVGITLSALSDGVVLVIEAERTRSPAAKQALQLLRRKGATIIGLAFNKRRYYIPRWLYDWL